MSNESETKPLSPAEQVRRAGYCGGDLRPEEITAGHLDWWREFGQRNAGKETMCVVPAEILARLGELAVSHMMGFQTLHLRVQGYEDYARDLFDQVSWYGECNWHGQGPWTPAQYAAVVIGKLSCADFAKNEAVPELQKLLGLLEKLKTVAEDHEMPSLTHAIAQRAQGITLLIETLGGRPESAWSKAT